MGKGWIYLISLTFLIEGIIGREVRTENQIGNSFSKEVEEERTSLSMEEVITLADQPKDFLVLNEELRKYWIYDVKKDLDEKMYAYATTYSIWYQEEEYLLDIVYRKKRKN